MGIFDMISSFLNPQKGYEKAADQSEQYYVNAQGQLRPLVQQGQAQYNRLNTQANTLNNPVDLENKWASSYKESPMATNLFNQAKTSALDAASSAGLLGSSATLGNIENTAGNIMESDRQNYMNDLMQKYMESIGIGQNIYGLGAGARTQMSNQTMDQGTSSANLAYGKENAPGDLLSKILGTVTNAGLNYATGGMRTKMPNAA